MRQSHTLSTTCLFTALQPMSSAAAANTWGMLPMRACHLSFSIAHLKHCMQPTALTQGMHLVTIIFHQLQQHASFPMSSYMRRWTIGLARSARIRPVCAVLQSLFHENPCLQVAVNYDHSLGCM